MTVMGHLPPLPWFRSGFLSLGTQHFGQGRSWLLKLSCARGVWGVQHRLSPLPTRCQQILPLQAVTTSNVSTQCQVSSGGGAKEA